LDLSFASCTYAYLPCTTLLNSEECALSEKKKKKNLFSWALKKTESKAIDGRGTRVEKFRECCVKKTVSKDYTQKT